MFVRSVTSSRSTRVLYTRAKSRIQGDSSQVPFWQDSQDNVALTRWEDDWRYRAAIDPIVFSTSSWA